MDLAGADPLIATVLTRPLIHGIMLWADVASTVEELMIPFKN